MLSNLLDDMMSQSFDSEIELVDMTSADRQSGASNGVTPKSPKSQKRERSATVSEDAPTVLVDTDVEDNDGLSPLTEPEDGSEAPPWGKVSLLFCYASCMLLINYFNSLNLLEAKAKTRSPTFILLEGFIV